MLVGGNIGLVYCHRIIVVSSFQKRVCVRTRLTSSAVKGHDGIHHLTKEIDLFRREIDMWLL